MDINDVRVFVTLASMVAFIGIAAWAYAKRNRARFDELAALPFADEPEVAKQGAKNE
ncbi:cbb3-type cytochrome oxidase subunit 3 [Pelomonas sp. CA6]|uniref:cbb3-type cytochrome oxidase subunit 3 n=1 Tax=Pelomonas sp. CA6 TaxID=2907999 RepID=UPI0035A9050B